MRDLRDPNLGSASMDDLIDTVLRQLRSDPRADDQIANRKRRGQQGGRPPAFDRDAYKLRNTVERCINCLKQWRGLATRYEKTATVYRAGLLIAGIFLWSAR
ncbi:transposase [Streptomyces sp. NPDC001339]|uniref:transposase n=1 Tax=Streptomyces sp. NPDC001339 TaxID=3364563 RepID=UPI003692BDC1